MKGKTLMLFGIIILLLTVSTGCKREEENLKENYAKVINLIESKKYEEAKELLKESIEKSPQNGKFYFMLGNVYRNEKRYEDALKYYYSAIEKSADLKEAYNNIAGIYMLEGKYENAMGIINDGLEKNPDFDELIFKKGQLIFFKKEYEETIELMEKISDKSKYVDSYRFIGISYLKLENREYGLKNLKTYLELTPDGLKEKEEIKHIVNRLK